MTHAPAAHYDRVTEAWTLLLGDDLHYGVFADAGDQLAAATQKLTQLMLDAARIAPGDDVLDVGCGTGAPACRLARAGARVTGITNSATGVRAARARAVAEGVGDHASFALADGMDNGFDDESFSCVWALESSHLMHRRDRFMAECARVLRRGGRLALCDIVLHRELDFHEVKRMLGPLSLLREVFGDARMEPLSEYRRLAGANGLDVVEERDLTAPTRPTFAAWRANAADHHDEVARRLGADGLRRFVEGCDVLQGLWDDGTLGYGLLVAVRR